MDFLIYFFPPVLLLIALFGFVWSIARNRRYIVVFVAFLLGGGAHYYGLSVGKWEGMGISLFFGGGFLLLGIVLLLAILLYNIIEKRRSMDREVGNS